MGRLNAIIWILLGVLAVGLVLSFLLDLGIYAWTLVVLMVVVLVLDFFSRMRRRE
ncbi:MAG: hypothetical protein KC482_16350 [Dehalococcoidia bacterium]|nr:hypothetical protein [Dehalococcoidia bacterium]MCA9825000.1 hypothetical protein [Dehalococcoidia bacterium]MCA9843790.1 hypothetical protein [Dehalococcoidia bacterium]MCA9855127.1 hypothetical protein [Dehalococcoidia bacterium]